jgi:hypothetical protein
MKQILSFLLFIALLCSCSAVKRHYTKGFYFEKHTQEKKIQKDNTLTIKSFYKKEKTTEQLTKEKETLTSLALIPQSKTKSLPVKLSLPDHISLKESCDTLFLRDGTVLAVQVVEVNEKKVKYRYCTGNDKDLRSVYTKDVEQLIFANGQKEIFTSSKSMAPFQENKKQVGKLSAPAVIGFILSFLVWFPCTLLIIYAFGYAYISFFYLLIALIALVIAIAFDIIGIIQIKSNGGKYKGMAFAVIGLILCLIPIFFFLLFNNLIS